MALWTVKLEFSPDPLSDTTPAWTNITVDLVSAEWFSGKSNDLDEPAAGGAVFRLANTNRRFEPEYVAGQFYPNIDTERRFRLTVTDATGAVQQGIYYAESWDLEFPAGTLYSEVVVSCVDGFGILASDNLATLDPPDATSYPDVVAFDEPAFYYRLGEPAGTKAISHVRKRKVKGKHGKTRTRKIHWKTVESRSEVEGVSGPNGTYKNLPALGQAGLIVGDPATSVLFTSSRSQYAQIQLTDRSDAIDTNALTVEGWAKPATIGLQQMICSGPFASGPAAAVYEIDITAAGFARFTFQQVGGGSTTVIGTTVLAAGNTYHIVGTWDGQFAAIYVNGNLESSASSPGKAQLQGDANAFIGIGTFWVSVSSGSSFFNGNLQDIAIYEKALSPARVQAHYNAGANRGFPAQLTGSRVAAVATSPLWSTAGVEAGAFQVLPLMQFGQPKLDVIVDAVQTERPKALFYFDTSGNPDYRDFDALDGATVAATFGDAGNEIRYSNIDLVYDNEVFNQLTGSRDGGEAMTVSDAQSISDRKTKSRDDEVGMPLVADDDVSTVLNTLLDGWKAPTLRPASLTVVGADAGRTSAVLRRSIGDRVRVRRRGLGGTAIDRQAVILGYRKTISKDRVLTATFNLSRGFNAGLSDWRLGVPGFAELGTTTRLG